MIVMLRVQLGIFVLLAIILLKMECSAAGFNDCLKCKAKNDNKIRIGFLSRYKSSKVS